MVILINQLIHIVRIRTGPCLLDVTSTATYDFSLSSTGYGGYFWVTYGGGVRAVINLSSEAQISGGIGTANSPYEIKVD